MSTTIREDSAVEFDPSALPRQWSLVIACHRSPTVLGLRRVVTKSSALDIGRACGAFGEGALDDPQLSRAHARFEVDPRGALVVNDLGSSNGTWVDGSRVGAASLRVGSVVRTGPLLFVVQHAPETFPTRRSERAAAIAWVTVEFMQKIRARIASAATVFIDAPCRSAWIEHLSLVAEELGRRVSFVRSLGEARALSREDVAVLSVRALSAADAKSLAEHSGATLVVEGVIEGLATAEDTAVLPALAERVEDIPWIVRGALSGASGKIPAIDAGFTSRLLLAAWPEDVDGVHRWAAAVARRGAAQDKLEWTGEDLSLTGGPRDASRSSAVRALEERAPSVGESTVIAKDGAWFAAPSEAPVDLRTRFALAKILRALVRAHEESPDKTLSLDDIVQAGWPGEKLISDSGSNRVYVAIATLRKLGLRDTIERREGGYRIAPRASISLTDDDFDRSGAR